MDSPEASSKPAAEEFSWLDPHPIFVIILVGPNEKPFGLQKDFLCAKCRHFRCHFDRGSDGSAAVEHVVHLPNTSVQVFAHAQHFLYTGRLSSNAAQLPSYDVLVNVWKLGHDLGIDGLCESTLEAMAECKRLTRSIPAAPLLVQVWKDTPAGSSIRQLLLSWAAQYLRTSPERAEFARSLPQELLSELVVAMSAHRDGDSESDEGEKKAEEAEAADKGDKGDKTDKTDKAEKADKTEKAKAGKVVRVNKTGGRASKTDKADKASKNEKDKADKNDKTDRAISRRSSSDRRVTEEGSFRKRSGDTLSEDGDDALSLTGGAVSLSFRSLDGGRELASPKASPPAKRARLDEPAEDTADSRNNAAPTNGHKQGRTSLPTQRGPLKRRSSVVVDKDTYSTRMKLNYCNELVTRMLSGPGFWTRLVGPFREAVDPVAEGLPDYFSKIKRPMDLTTIKNNLDQGRYATEDEFLADMRQIFQNVYTYWTDKDPVWGVCTRLEKTFQEKYNSMYKALDKQGSEYL